MSPVSIIRMTAAGLTPQSHINRPPRLADLVYDKLKESLLNFNLQADRLYSEKELAEFFGVSRAPVREAIIRLNNEHLVEILPNRGMRVVELDERDIAECFELRHALESWVVRHLAEGLSQENKHRLHKSLKRQAEVVQANDRQRWVVENTQFHMELARCVGNQRIVRILGSTSEQIQRIGLALIPRLRPMKDAFADHQAIVKAIIAGDSLTAEQSVHGHLSRTAELFRRLRQRQTTDHTS